MPNRTCGEDREVALSVGSVLVRLHAMRSLLHPALRARLKHHRVASHPQVYSYYSIVHSVNIVQSLHRLQTLYAILLGLHELYSILRLYSPWLRARASPFANRFHTVGFGNTMRLLRQRFGVGALQVS